MAGNEGGSPEPCANTGRASDRLSSDKRSRRGNVIFRLSSTLVLIHIVWTWLQAIRRGLNARRLETHEATLVAADLPPVSVIIPAWNERGTIERCVSALRSVEYPTWEVVILAGGSDGTFDVACRTTEGDDRFRVLERGDEPKNAALRRGIDNARHDVLVLLDADNIVEPGWLHALIVPFLHGFSVSVGHKHANLSTWVTQHEEMTKIISFEILGRPIIEGDRSIAIRHDLLEAIGGLPFHAYAREDWDITVRLDQAGYPIAFAKDAVLVTDRPATTREYLADNIRFRRTLLAGLWEYRDEFARHQPLRAFGQLYFFFVSFGVCLAVLTGAVVGVRNPALRPAVGRASLLLSAWLLLRPPANALMVFAYTGQRFWMTRAWTATAAVLVELLASIVAVFSLKRQNPFYKGIRH